MTKHDRSIRGQVAAVLVVVSGVVFAALIMPASVCSAEPAVKEMNGRLIGDFSFGHTNSETTQSTLSGAPDKVLPEEDLEAGGLTGILTIPLGDAFGARMFVSPNGSKRNPPGLSETRTKGIAAGGDLFWRDPNLGQVSLGPRYEWNSIDPGGNISSVHSAGLNVSGTVFLDDFGLGPVNLGVVGDFLDSDIKSTGSQDRNRFYSAEAILVLFPSDQLALGARGGWSRQNLSASNNVITSTGGFFMDFLLPVQPAVTFGADLRFGQREQSIANFSTFGRSFYQLGVSLTISFPGAKSLVELERNYY